MKRNRGFAVITAIGLMVLLSAALLALTAIARQDMTRTQRTSTDAQLRQLLLAGTALAGTFTPSPEDYSIQLPPDLSNAALHVRISGTNGDQRSVIIRATVDGRSAVQTVQLIRTTDTWQALSATHH